MHRRAAGRAACLLLILLSGATRGAWSWEPLEYPGAVRTYANGVWGDKIVGYYAKDGGHGFVYDGSVWTTLDFPGADSTTASGIWQNKIVGYYSMPEWYTYRAGFLYDGRTWTTLAYPGAAQTVATGVWGDRVIGSYLGSDQCYHGFVYDSAGWHPLDYPAGGWHSNTALGGIEGETIVGAYSRYSGTGRGLRYDGQTWTVVHPEGTYLSSLVGISGNNMVGNCQLTFGSDQAAFLFDGNTWAWLNYPGASSTEVAGISGDRIVGLYVSGGEAYSFVLTMPEPASLGLLAVAALLVPRRRRV